MSTLEELKARLEKAKTAYGRMLEFINRRSLSLAEKEEIVIERVLKKEISMLNPSSKKGGLIYATMVSRTLELECKIHRRGLFFINIRKRALEEKIAKLEAELAILEPKPEATQEPASAAADEAIPA